jgi:hypothetical protein
MTSEIDKGILYTHRNLRLSARILGTIEVVFMFYIAFTEFREEIANQSTSPVMTLINGQYFLTVTLTIALIGLLLAYWKEGLGGGIALAAFTVFFIGWSDFHLNFIFFMILVSLPAILYFAYWLLVYLDHKKASREQTTKL